MLHVLSRDARAEFLQLFFSEVGGGRNGGHGTDVPRLLGRSHDLSPVALCIIVFGHTMPNAKPTATGKYGNQACFLTPAGTRRVGHSGHEFVLFAQQ